MKHFKSVVAVLALAPMLLCLLAQAQAASRIDYADLWNGLSPSEKELLLIGYARGLKTAEARVQGGQGEGSSARTGAEEPSSAGARPLAEALTAAGAIKAVVEQLNRSYAEEENRFVDWTMLVEVALNADRQPAPSEAHQ
ncbi:MAG: hypothetical protein V2A77_11010 [Pseudomonadota bacterium]